MMRFESSQDIGVLAGVVILGFALLLASRAFPGYADVISLLFAALMLGALFRWPASPILIMYPLLWVLGPYNIDLLGGRVERLVALSGVLGLLIVLSRGGRLSDRIMPPVLWGGITITLGAYLVSWVAHPDLADAENMFISLLSRILFLVLIAFFVQNERDLKTVITLFIISTFVGCAITFWIGWEHGFGYIRDYYLNKTVQENVPQMLQVISRNMNHATAAGVLLLAMYPNMRTSLQKILLLLGVLFTFWMAFAAEFRREILVTVPAVLTFLYFDKRSRLSRVALPLLVVSTVLFIALLLPSSPILQDRLERETPTILEQREPRIVSFAVGLSAFFEAPLVGHGPGSYARTVFPMLPYDADPIARGAYNVFIWIAVEAGVLGLIGVLIIIVGAYYQARSLRSVQSTYIDIVVRLGPLFVVLIVIWFSFGNAWDGSVPWFLMGLILAAARITKEKNARAPR